MYNHKNFAFLLFFLTSYKSYASSSIQNAKNPQLVKFAYLETLSKAKQENKRSNTELFEKISDDVWKLMIYKYFNLKMLSNFKSTNNRFHHICNNIDAQIESEQKEKILSSIEPERHFNNKYLEIKEPPCDICINNISHIKTFEDIVTNNSFAFKSSIDCFPILDFLLDLLCEELPDEFYYCGNNKPIIRINRKITLYLNENHKRFLKKIATMIKTNPVFIKLIAKSDSYKKKIENDIRENYPSRNECYLGSKFYEYQIFGLYPRLFFKYLIVFKKHKIIDYIMLRDYTICYKSNCDDCYSYDSRHSVVFFKKLFNSATKDDIIEFFFILKYTYHLKRYYDSFDNCGDCACGGIIDSLAKKSITLFLIKCLIRTRQIQLIAPFLCVIGNQIPYNYDEDYNYHSYPLPLELDFSRQTVIAEWMDNILGNFNTETKEYAWENFKWSDYSYKKTDKVYIKLD